MTTVKLTSPIKIDGKEVNEINLRRPKVRDRLAVERSNFSDAEKEVQLIANLAELPIDVIEDIDLADYAKLQRALSDFLSE
jgi:hypothetical protein